MKSTYLSELLGNFTTIKRLRMRKFIICEYIREDDDKAQRNFGHIYTFH